MFTINTKIILVVLFSLTIATLTFATTGSTILTSFAQSASAPGTPITNTSSQDNNALVCSGVQFCTNPAPIKQDPLSVSHQTPQKSFSSPASSPIRSNPGPQDNNALVCSGVQFCTNPVPLSSVNMTNPSVSQVNTTLTNEGATLSTAGNNQSSQGETLQSQSPLQQQQQQQQQEQQQPSTSSWLDAIVKFFGGG
ncbi:MAG: hypothetical protein M3162_07410 [Thermoproteota archaeon]|nr:hypothetical protein [Thermoproteota archaeon]